MSKFFSLNEFVGGFDDETRRLHNDIEIHKRAV